MTCHVCRGSDVAVDVLPEGDKAASRLAFTCASPCNLALTLFPPVCNLCNLCRGGALVAMDLGFMGPNYFNSTACASPFHLALTFFPSVCNLCNLCRGGALVAMDLGFMGPNYSISTACATANYCFVAAANHIRKGDADLIIAGGSEAPIIPVGLGGFVACR